MKQLQILLAIVFTVCIVACNGSSSGNSVSNDSNAVNWHDSCEAAYAHVQDNFAEAARCYEQTVAHYPDSENPSMLILAF